MIFELYYIYYIIYCYINKLNFIIGAVVRVVVNSQSVKRWRATITKN